MKLVAIGLYIVLVYWVSSRFTSLHSLFFPTLGAFSLLFAGHNFTKAKVYHIFLGAMVSSVLGTLFFYIHHGAVSLFINTLLVIWLIHKCKWNAPPILAVSFIPFFVHSSNAWVIPLSVFVSLLGLLCTLLVVEIVEKSAILPKFNMKKNVSAEAE